MGVTEKNVHLNPLGFVLKSVITLFPLRTTSVFPGSQSPHNHSLTLAVFFHASYLPASRSTCAFLFLPLPLVHPFFSFSIS